MSKRKDVLVESYESGYRVVDGIPYNPDGKRLKGWIQAGYHYIRPTKKVSLAVHRLVVYQKFGEEMFAPDIEVRHLDNNKLNNLAENIGIGNRSENMMDLPKERRVEMARKQSTKYDADEIKRLYEELGSYSKVMKATGIKSKGTIAYIINKR